jgi:hypothetical protein
MGSGRLSMRLVALSLALIAVVVAPASALSTKRIPPVKTP